MNERASTAAARADAELQLMSGRGPEENRDGVESAPAPDDEEQESAAVDVAGARCCRW